MWSSMDFLGKIHIKHVFFWCYICNIIIQFNINSEILPRDLKKTIIHVKIQLVKVGNDDYFAFSLL